MSSAEEFINLSKNIHGELYLYGKVNYINPYTKVVLGCKLHGEFLKTPYHHVDERFKAGCPICARSRRRIEQSLDTLNNKFKGLIQPEDHKLIPLTQGKFAKVDNEDFEKVKDINWCYSKGYAVNSEKGRLHRFILNAPKNGIVDHVDRDPLNNCRANLRLTSPSLNLVNQGPRTVVTSQYRGVCFDKSRSKWLFRIKIPSGRILSKRFKHEHEAAEEYNKQAVKYYGEFANLNIIKNEDVTS